MDTITFEIKSPLRLKLGWVDFPDLCSSKKWVQKGIDILKQRLPRVLRYLSRERILSHLQDYHILLKTGEETNEEKIRPIFNLWLKKEKNRRLLYVVFEALALPFTPILALLPGPNVFFYVPALLLYYHYKSYRALSRLDTAHLSIQVIYS